MSLLACNGRTTGHIRSHGVAARAPCAAIMHRPHRTVPTFRLAAAAASIDTVSAAEPVAEPLAEPPAEAAAEDATGPQQVTKRSSKGRSRSSRDAADGPVTVRVGAQTQSYAVAGFMAKSFQDRGDGLMIVLQAVGPAACATAIKALARLQQMVADNQASGYCINFKFKRFRSDPYRKGTQQDDESATENDVRVKGFELLVTLGNKADWPAATFDTSSGSKDSSSKDDSSSSSSSSSSSKKRDVDPKLIIPTLVKANSEDEVPRLIKHAMRSSELQKPAQFVVTGSKQNKDAAALRLCGALAEARRTAYLQDEPSDLMCTVVAVPYTVERTERKSSSSSSSREQQAEGSEQPAAAPSSAPTAADAADAAEPAAAAGDVGSEGEAADPAALGPLKRVRYLVTVQRCDPGPKALAAAAKRKEEQQQSSEGTGPAAAAAKGREGGQQKSGKPRPGYIEVREEEWNQLKEQLAVVPHLTEQLQIMTRQHEQLLSLLAAQQGQQQQDSA